MKLHLESSDGTYQIQSVDLHSVTINEKAYSQNLIVMPEYLAGWAVEDFDKLEVAHFEQLCALEPEVVLLGTGTKIRFPATELLAPLINAGIGVEVMDTRAVCRTYVILTTEGRKVAAALLFEE
ncbi:Mth938-like domain-containing protein [Candidatus Parabeggiatoa sp. HSG14]|uniref:Mth938-like domain-containing protein n=1 Tax=Candidatus Parabeggiatoa sp. HSG14 TaxID=3055593 RepID=UPI0025A841DB|nr:Mth938-like domain-containing protein [Thiotrichales bacterium HSG14]